MAIVLGELYVNILSRLDGVQEGFAETKKGLDEVSQRIDVTSKKMVTFGKSMTTKVTLPLSALGTLAVKTAAETEGAMDKFNVVFRGSEKEMQAWVDAFRNDFPLARGQIVKMSADLQDLLVPAGVARKEAAGMTQDWFKLAGALAAFNDVPIAEILEAQRSGIAKQIEPLRRYGINATVAAVEQEALAQGLMKAGEEMSDQVYQQALLSLAYKQSADALNGLEAQQGSLLWQFEEMKADIIDLAAEIGRDLIPAVRDGVTWVKNGVEWFKNLDDSTKENILRLAGLVAAIGPVTYALGRLGQGMTLTYRVGSTLIDTSLTLGKTLKTVLEGSEAAGTAFKNMASGADKSNVLTKTLGNTLGWLASNPMALVIAGAAAVGAALIAMAKAEEKAYMEAIENETKALEQQINDNYNSKIDALEKEMQAILEQSKFKKDALITDRNQLKDILDDELDAIERRHEKERQEIEDTGRELENSYQDRIDAIKDEYGTYELKAESKIAYEQRIAQEAIAGLEEIKKVAKEQHDERIKQLEEQAYAQLSDEEKAAINAIQDQIDAIDEQTKAEEKALREQENQKRIAQLRERIAEEDDADRRKELQEDLQEFLADIERERLLEKREAEKASLRDEIELVKSEYERKREEIKNGLNQELEDAKLIEDEKLAEVIKKVNESIKEQERERDEKIKILIDERDEKLRIAEEEYNSAVEYNDKRLEALQAEQEDEIREYNRTKDAALAAFDETGYYFSEMQKGMRSEIQETISDIEAEIQAYKDAKEEALKAGKVAEEAKAKIDLVKESQKSIQDYWQQQGTYEGDIAPPAFHEGGVFKAPAGQNEGLALLKNDEVVLTTEQQKTLLNGKFGSITNNFNIANMNVANENDLSRWAAEVYSMQDVGARSGIR